MKKLVIFLFCLVASTSLRAKVVTVSNADSTAQYTTIQAACDSSANGDSIYVSASSIAYNAFTINDKKLAIFGPGWQPFAGNTANVSGCTLTGVGASGSELHGLTFTSTIYIQTAGLNNVIFNRNRLNYIQIYGTVSGYIFEGNWFVSAYLYSPGYILSNFMLRNNIFYNYYPYNFKGTSILFDHNLWYGSGNSFYSCEGLTISNNIFINKNTSGITASIFNNNLTYNCDNDAPWATNDNNDAGGNLAGQYPQIAAQTSINNNVNNPLLDFTISTGPANNSASDGKDMGLLYDKGGSANWTRSRAARFPYISKFNLNSQSVFKNGKIYFNGEAKSN